jgi:hypothetical protein
MNPNASPPPASGSSLFPGSAVGTIGSSTSSGAWPTSTAPPSLSTGPRYTQPQPWQATPREVAISARTPADPLTSQPSSTGQTGYTYPTQPTGSYQPPTYAQPTGAWNQPAHVAQAGYPPGTQPTNNTPYPAGGQYATGTTTAAQQGQPIQPGQPLQPGQPGTQAPINYVASSPGGVKEPASPSDKAHTTAATTAQQSEGQWLPLTLVLVGFLTSLACNLYFGWSTYQLRERYRLLLADRGGAFSA